MNEFIHCCCRFEFELELEFEIQHRRLRQHLRLKHEFREKERGRELRVEIGVKGPNHWSGAKLTITQKTTTSWEQVETTTRKIENPSWRVV